jgi:hypothetical protein
MLSAGPVSDRPDRLASAPTGLSGSILRIGSAAGQEDDPGRFNSSKSGRRHFRAAGSG